MAKSRSASFCEAFLLHRQLQGQVVPWVPQAFLPYVSSLDPSSFGHPSLPAPKPSTSSYLVLPFSFASPHASYLVASPNRSSLFSSP